MNKHKLTYLFVLFTFISIITFGQNEINNTKYLVILPQTISLFISILLKVQNYP